jgi:hypothetical protein
MIQGKLNKKLVRPHIQNKPGMWYTPEIPATWSKAGPGKNVRSYMKYELKQKKGCRYSSSGRAIASKHKALS